jgi:hypothetical protein
MPSHAQKVRRTFRDATGLHADVPNDGRDSCDGVTDNFRVLTPTEFRLYQVGSVQ